jgi:palmitoyltransferase
MDHHCPWINNCVGFYNRKHFMLLLIYVLLCTYTIAGVMARPVYETVLKLYEHPSIEDAKPFVQVGAYALDVMLALVLSSFIKFHFGLVFTNSTTIETMDKSAAKKGEFNKSCKQNWKQVFGANPWLWPFPVTCRSGGPVGDGVVWRPEATHQEDEIPNNEADRKSSTLTGSKGSLGRVMFSPGNDTAPVNRQVSPYH